MMKKIAVLAMIISTLALTGCGKATESKKDIEISENETTTAAVTAEVTENEEPSTETTEETVEEITTEASEISETTEDSASTPDESSTETSNGNNADQPNEYGYYPVETPLYTSISVASLAGVWYDNASIANFLTIERDADDLYIGTWKYEYEGGGSRSGNIKLEKMLDHDYDTLWFTFYEEDGELWQAFAATGDIPLNDIYAGQSGEPHFTRVDTVG